MKRIGGLCIALFGAAGLFAQGHVGTATRGGARAGGIATRPAPAIPGVPAHPPNILYPASGTPQRVSPGFGRRSSGASVFYYPVYIPYGGYSGYYDNSYANPYISPEPGPDPSYSQQPNMVYAPPAYPMYPPNPPETARSRTDINPYVAQDEGPPPMQTDDSASKHYLIALKDHTVYAAIAYWVDGDTVHYFTAGNVHNQTSLSLIDRDLTERLNKESGQKVNLPAAK